MGSADDDYSKQLGIRRTRAGLFSIFILVEISIRLSF